MKNWTWGFALLFTLAAPIAAQEGGRTTGFFTDPKELFRPLVADPWEIHLGLRLVSPVSKKNFGEIKAGEYFGLYRWALPWTDSYLQWSIAGGVLARFELVTEQKGNEVIDYFANMPVDARFGQWSVRLLPFHSSSHLGDDYIKQTGAIPQKYSFDCYKTLVAYEPNSRIRIYGGHAYIIRNVDHLSHRYALQSGLEWISRSWWGGRAQWFAATDFQAWQRTGWNPNTNTQLGIRLAKPAQERQRLSFYGEYGSGRRYHGQFYNRQESRWVLGLKFEP